MIKGEISKRSPEINGRVISSVADKPVKYLGKVYNKQLNDREQTEETLKELRSLGRDLQVIRLQVEQQLGGSQRSEDWIQVGFIIDRLLFGLYILFISVSFITIIIIWVKMYSQ